VLAVQRGPLAAQHRQDDLQRLLELLEPLGERAERDAVGVVLELEPARADAELARPPDTWSRAVMIFASTPGCGTCCR
jgi:hypothetical protein